MEDHSERISQNSQRIRRLRSEIVKLDTSLLNYPGYNVGMSRTVIQNLRGAFTLALIVLNIIFWFIPILVIAVMKLAVPIDGWRRITSNWLVICAENWISFNKAILSLTGNIYWDVRGLTGLRRQEWYLVVSNHQTWVDILVLQYVFNRRVPFFKFFIKQQLIWVPFLGLAWWALDMPFMKRYSKSELAANPEKKGKDLETTRRACEKFQTIPTSVINFVEGTRATPEKIRRRESPYRFLLRPRSGGIAFALGAMAGILKAMIDVTIVYADPSFRFWDLCCGRITRVIMDIRVREIPAWINEGDYTADTEFRQRFHRWISEIWAEKDELIATLRSEVAAASAPKPRAELLSGTERR